jgi:hypothetical protein
MNSCNYLVLRHLVPSSVYDPLFPFPVNGIDQGKETWPSVAFSAYLLLS